MNLNFNVAFFVNFTFYLFGAMLTPWYHLGYKYIGFSFTEDFVIF